MKILVLGGGQQGRVIAGDLAAALPDAAVTVADLKDPGLPAANVRWQAADLSDVNALAKLLEGHDLGVGALPAAIGFLAMRAAIDARRPMIDVSFSAEDPLALDGDARRAGIAIVPDCGLAPGLSHLLAGRFAARHGTPNRLVIRVGGVAEDASRPYGYVVTWSLPDLLEEYTRPARIVRNGAIIAAPALAELERVHIEGAGEMEAFLSDGLRTLLVTLPGVREMEEKTLRWPGHVEQIRPLLASGTLLEEFRAKCVIDPPRDRVVMSVEAEWDGTRRSATLLDRFDPRTGLTAMARTTALTTATVARLAATGGLTGAGVLPLERVARDEGACTFITGALRERGVTISSADGTG